MMLRSSGYQLTVGTMVAPCIGELDARFVGEYFHIEVGHETYLPCAGNQYAARVELMVVNPDSHPPKSVRQTFTLFEQRVRPFLLAYLSKLIPLFEEALPSSTEWLAFHIDWNFDFATEELTNPPVMNYNDFPCPPGEDDAYHYHHPLTLPVEVNETELRQAIQAWLNEKPTMPVHEAD